jgi:multidrug resistance efflux pump
MTLKKALPLLALAMTGYAMFHVVRAWPNTGAPSGLLEEPNGGPYADSIAASGIVEAQTENIAVGAPVAGIVTQVKVRVGQKVKAGDALFCLDDRELLAELNCQQANLRAARAQLARIENQPRLEELPAAEARVREAEANLQLERDQLDRQRRLRATGATSTESLVVHKQRFQTAKERLARAQADLTLLKAGAWKYDKEAARAAVAQAGSHVERVKTQLERLTVRALIGGDILRVDVRPGEYVGAPAGRALILLGGVHPLHVRVSIDEHEGPRFRIGAAAQARLKGASGAAFALTFVRVEPFVIPKPSLTGSSMERTDTRVLQVIYAIEPHRVPLYVGQQMDVCIETSR